MADLDKLEQLHRAATPELWPDPLPNGCIVIQHGDRREIVVRLQYCSPDDAAVIVAARNALAELIEAARQLERARAYLKSNYGETTQVMELHAVLNDPVGGESRSIQFLRARMAAAKRAGENDTKGGDGG